MKTELKKRIQLLELRIKNLELELQMEKAGKVQQLPHQPYDIMPKFPILTTMY